MEKRSTISKKTLKIILGICIGVTILAVAGLFVYTYLADHNTLGRKISIWGVDVSGLDAKQAEEKIAAEFADRPVSFQENDQEHSQQNQNNCCNQITGGVAARGFDRQP